MLSEEEENEEKKTVQSYSEDNCNEMAQPPVMLKIAPLKNNNNFHEAMIEELKKIAIHPKQKTNTHNTNSNDH